MNTFAIRSDAASLEVTETGGHLSDVTFWLADGRRVAPMHTAPWYHEALPADTPPMMRVLRGDFFCAPFGENDVIGGPPHGASASGRWVRRASGKDWVEAVLDETILGATMTKQVSLRQGEAMVYQRHTFHGGSGRIPVAHHAMLYAKDELKLAFAPRVFAGTPPGVIEVPPAGRSLLAYPQEIGDLTAARTADGGTVDLTTYPGPSGYEDIWMVASDAKLPFAWTAATCTREGWVWFSIKNPRALPSTTMWMSNGGRDYAPWSGRHARVIGLEETCGYFHLGHAASIAENPLSARGIPTAVTLRPDVSLTISYAFGLAAAPATFGGVADIHAAQGGVVITDVRGGEVFAACDLSFVTA
jgi:hypothetical protein